MRATHRQAVASIAVVGAVLTAGACSEQGATPSTGKECENLLQEQAPDLERRAGELLEIDASGLAWADCDSGGSAAVVTGLPASTEHLVQRMKKLGTAEQMENSACLEHLPTDECDQVWRYAPQGEDSSYIVEFPSAGAAGEVAIAVNRLGRG